MRFSVILPSRLIPYQGCAKYLDQKLVRAVKSVIDQSFEDFELIIIADGCPETKEIVSNNFTDERIVLLECTHKAVFDNLPRNTGLSKARGEYIIYIDADDYWGRKHLAIIDHSLKDFDWVWYNDYAKTGEWAERACNIKSMGGCGTSNICHKSNLGLKWDRPGYAHDFHFAQKLLKFKNHDKIETPEYFVMHIPGVYDV
jgi:glycosyltransferase involved in cell wall biosynthesis